MVDLTGSSSPFQQSIPNLVFYVPAVVVFGLAGKSCVHFFFYFLYFIFFFFNIFVVVTFFGDVERRLFRKHFIVVEFYRFN